MKRPTRTIPLRRPTSGRARRPREDPKVPGPQTVLPKSARPESKTNTEAGENGTQQVLQELHLSSEGSDSDTPEGAGETSKGADPDNSGMGPPIPPEELRVPPGTLSLDQVPSEGQDTLTLTWQEVNPADPDTSAQDPLPMLAEQTQSPGPSIPDTSATAASGSGQALPKDVPVIPTTSSSTQTNDRPDANSITGVMARLKEVCNIMTTGFQCACLDVETIVHRLLEGAKQLKRRFAEAAFQDLNTWVSALQPVLDSGGGCLMPTWRQGRVSPGKPGGRSATGFYLFHTR